MVSRRDPPSGRGLAAAVHLISIEVGCGWHDRPVRQHQAERDTAVWHWHRCDRGGTAVDALVAAWGENNGGVDARTWVAIAAAAISLAALLVSLWIARRTRVEGRRPVLVFVFGGSDWKLVNVGAGPAVSVQAAQRVAGQWVKPLRLPAIAKDGEVVIPRDWVKWEANPGLAAVYLDMDGRSYTSTSADDATTVRPGRRVTPWPGQGDTAF